MPSLISQLLHIILMALGMLLFQLTFIIVGSRLGWFVWIAKKVMGLLRRKS